MSSSAVLEYTMRLEFFARCLERRISDPVKSPGRQKKRKEREKGKKEEESSYEYMEAFQSRPIRYHKISASSVSLLLVFMGDEESSLEIL